MRSKVFHIIGSQVLARDKRRDMPQTRNNLIDDELLVHQTSNLYEKEDSISEQDDEPRRRNSFETVSTDIDIDDGGNISEVSDEQAKKPRWHPPWQLKQVILIYSNTCLKYLLDPVFSIRLLPFQCIIAFLKPRIDI